jgi:hypothetical protein
LDKEEGPVGSRAPPFRGLVKQLSKENILPKKLSADLFDFNNIANIPAKHFTASKKYNQI